MNHILFTFKSKANTSHVHTIQRALLEVSAYAHKQGCSTDITISTSGKKLLWMVHTGTVDTNTNNITAPLASLQVNKTILNCKCSMLNFDEVTNAPSTDQSGTADGAGD